ncbi:MAG: hypothetical protein H6Q10_2098 [Acidobacteria bacterium]|nr:hypothetical protein [Acidobacteriota bacterium]
MKPAGERRQHPRSWSVLGRARVVARLHAGPPLRVLNASADGMLVESPARLLPGRQVELMLQSGTSWDRAPWVVIHSRVGCIRGSADLRYRAGLHRVTGSDYPSRRDPRRHGNQLPAPSQAGSGTPAANTQAPDTPAAGTRFEQQDRT